jgi:hypothetical protein
MSNRRKRERPCAEEGCRRASDIQVMELEADRVTVRSTRWLCIPHATAYARAFKGNVWGDSQCQCGCVDGIIHDAGRTRQGNL